MSRPSIIRGRCEWANCRKWPVPGSKCCKEHVQATQELAKAATIDAIAIEKLELKAEAGEATQAQVIQRQRKSVATYSAAEQASNTQLKDRKPPGPIAVTVLAFDGTLYNLGSMSPDASVSSVKTELSQKSEVNSSCMKLYLVDDKREDGDLALLDYETLCGLQVN